MGSPETSGVSGNRLLYAFACRDTDRLEVRLLMRCLHEIEAGQEEIRQFFLSLIRREEAGLQVIMPRISQAAERDCALRDTVAFIIMCSTEELREQYSTYLERLNNPHSSVGDNMNPVMAN